MNVKLLSEDIFWGKNLSKTNPARKRAHRSYVDSREIPEYLLCANPSTGVTYVEKNMNLVSAHL
jgi:hypothetical protein